MIRTFQGDNLEVSGHLSKYDAVIFDPEFPSIYKNEHGSYSNFIESRLIASYERLNHNSVLVLVGYKLDSFKMKTFCINELHLNPVGLISVPTHCRYGKNKTISLDIWFMSKRQLTTAFFYTSEVRHHPGSGMVNEAMAEHEAEKITYFLKKYHNCHSILDMFGGAGQIPVSCLQHNINCDCIEKNKTRALNIKTRVNIEELKKALYEPRREKKCIICNDKNSAKGFCNRHYQNIRNDWNENRKSEIRGWISSNLPITSGVYYKG